MIRCGKGPRGMSASERSGNSASWVLRSGVGYRAFSGLPTMTSSSGSHSLQLQTRDIDTTPPPFGENLADSQDHSSNPMLRSRRAMSGQGAIELLLVPHHRTELLKKSGIANAVPDLTAS